MSQMKIGKSAFFLAVAFCLVALSSCLTLAQSVDTLASQVASQGLLSYYQVSVLKSAAKAAVEASRRLSPEEEYYIGRAVAASIFSKYPPRDDRSLNAYLNKLGQGLALYSSRPEIFRGYRFICLSSAEVNAFATPGGHVLIARGLLRLAHSEDELAAALAHEIAHVALGHGLSSVQGAKIVKIASELAIDAGNAAGGDVAAFTTVFGDSIADLARTLIISGYSQTYEFQADLEARHILAAAGYDPDALSRLISRLPSRGQDQAVGFAATHPEPVSRLEALASRPLEEAKGGGSKRAIPVARAESPLSETAEFISPFIVRAERFTAMRGNF